MVVEGFNTIVAHTAVVRPWWPVMVACFTIFDELGFSIRRLDLLRARD